jgi:hypothetical protein
VAFKSNYPYIWEGVKKRKNLTHAAGGGQYASESATHVRFIRVWIDSVSSLTTKKKQPKNPTTQKLKMHIIRDYVF